MAWPCCEGGSWFINLHHCKQLVSDLEADPQRLPAFYCEVEQAIEWLMTATFESKNKGEKQRLSAVELRLRLVLDRFKKERAN